MRYAQVQVFNNLHVVTRNHNAQVAQGTHSSSGEPAQANRCAPDGFRGAQGVQNIQRIPASTDGKCNVSGPSKVC